MTEKEWELLCDGCGLCCLNKILDEDKNIVYYTKIGCKLLDNQTCKCSNYKNRFQFVPDLFKINTKPNKRT